MVIRQYFRIFTIYKSKEIIYFLPTYIFIGIRLSLFAASWAGASCCFLPFFLSAAKCRLNTEQTGVERKKTFVCDERNVDWRNNMEDFKQELRSRFIPYCCRINEIIRWIQKHGIPYFLIFPAISFSFSILSASS